MPGSPAARKKSKKTFEQALKYLQEFFRTAPKHETKKLWDTLLALRGPDFRNDNGIKSRSTGVIRHAFLGRPGRDTYAWLPETYENGSAIATQGELIEFTRLERYRWDHFIGHIGSAAAALGITIKETD